MKCSSSQVIEWELASWTCHSSKALPCCEIVSEWKLKEQPIIIRKQMLVSKDTWTPAETLKGKQDKESQVKGNEFNTEN